MSTQIPEPTTEQLIETLNNEGYQVILYKEPILWRVYLNSTTVPSSRLKFHHQSLKGGLFEALNFLRLAKMAKEMGPPQTG